MEAALCLSEVGALWSANQAPMLLKNESCVEEKDQGGTADLRCRGICRNVEKDDHRGGVELAPSRREIRCGESLLMPQESFRY